MLQAAKIYSDTTILCAVHLTLVVQGWSKITSQQSCIDITAKVTLCEPLLLPFVPLAVMG